jgi:hypothetical protein
MIYDYENRTRVTKMKMMTPLHESELVKVPLAARTWLEATGSRAAGHCPFSGEIDSFCPQ